MAVVSHRELIAEGLKAMLAPYPEKVRIVGTWPQVTGANGHSPEVLLLDVDLDGSGTNGSAGLERVSRLMQHAPPFGVAVLTDQRSERWLYEVLRLGVRGYLLKSQSGAELAESLLRVRSGEVVIDPAMATEIVLRSTRLEVAHRSQAVARALRSGYFA